MKRENGDSDCASRMQYTYRLRRGGRRRRADPASAHRDLPHQSQDGSQHRLTTDYKRCMHTTSAVASVAAPATRATTASVTAVACAHAAAEKAKTTQHKRSLNLKHIQVHAQRTAAAAVAALGRHEHDAGRREIHGHRLQTTIVSVQSERSTSRIWKDSVVRCARGSR